MEKTRKFPIYLILICIIVAILFSGCSPDSINAKAVAEIQASKGSSLADTLAIGLSESLAEKAQEEIINLPELPARILLEAPRPKIEPEIQKIIKEQPKEKIKVLFTVKNKQDLEKISKIIKESSGEIHGEFRVGSVISAEIGAEKLEKISEHESIGEISAEKEYFAFLNESIPQISIDTAVWAQNYTGKGVKIAVLDTGIDTGHEMFKGRVLLSKSFNSEGINDLNGHGSHCAGIAAGNGLYKGAAPDAYLINAKVLTSTGSGTTSSIIAGINWAVDPDGNESTDDGADIISMSFGGALTDLDGPLAGTIRAAIDKGVIFVAASGNCRQGCGSFFSVTMPGSMPEVITVGAVNEHNIVASFSSGDSFNGYIKPDVVAPGVNIISAAKNNGYKSASGTSMSTPMVAGLIALMLEKESLNHAQAKAKLESTALDLGNPGKDTAYGSGLVNVSAIFAGKIVEEDIEKNETEEKNEAETNEDAPILIESRIIEENIGEFSFLAVKSIQDNESAMHNFAIYAKDETRLYIREVIFDNILDFIKHLYITVPIASFEEIIFANGPSAKYNYVRYGNKLFWYSHNSVYSAETLNISLEDAGLLAFLDAYSEKTANNIGNNFEENLRRLSEIDELVFKQMHDTEMNKLASSDKNESINPQWGGSTPSKAAKIKFGESYFETFWTEKADNWYHTETSKRGKLEFGVKNIYPGDDIDIYVYDWEAKNLLCKSTKSGSVDDYCFVNKNTDTNWGFYIKIVPYKISGLLYTTANVYTKASCTAGWLGEQECRSGNNLYGKYQESNCNIVWKKIIDCNTYNDPGSWYCENSNTAKKVSYDGYCDSGTSSCKKTQSTSTNNCASAEKCSKGQCIDKTCSDYSGNGGTCSWLDYSLSNTYCVGGTNGNPAICRKFGNTYCWDYTASCKSDEYCYDPWNGPAACFAYPCEISSVSWDSASAVKDSKVGITVQGSYCKSSDYVTFEVYENDCWGILEANASVMSNETNFSAQGICNTAVNTQPAKAYFSGNKAVSTWTAEYQKDVWGNPEYYVWAYLNGDSSKNKRSSGKLTVSCLDNDGDGYSPTGGVCGTPVDCNDNDASINPGAKEICNGKDDNCNGVIDEGFDLQNDNNNCGACGNSCGSGGTCIQGQCYSSVCSGYADTAGSCFTKGQFKRDHDRLYKCENMLWWGELLCWKHKSSLGDNNYCSDFACGWGDYDCDKKSQCSGDLVCSGNSWTCYGVECGCCNSNEQWDKSSKTCKKQDGFSCSANSQCHSTHCVHNICRPTDPYYGDGHCDKGETCSNSPNDCGKCNGAICVTDVECQGGYCVHNSCWTSAYKIGDGFCDQNLGESPSNSPNDCYGDLDVIQITSYPTTLNQGQSFQVKAVIQNKGTIRDILKLEAGLPPDSWYNLLTSSNDTFGTQSYHSITKCCPGNEYYDAVEITLDPGQSETVTFNLKAPTIHSVDDCDSSKKSAWDSQHKLVVGLYSACGQGYVNYKAKTVKVNEKTCYKDSDCKRSDEYCKFITNTQGICAVLVCADTCTNYDSYFCKDNTEIWRCADYDKDGCYEEKYIKSCYGNYACIDGQSNCKDMAVYAGVKAEESQSFVFKQPGDVLHINLLYSRNEDVQLEYNSDVFMLDTETCPAEKFALKGSKDCRFKISDNAQGDYKIGLKHGSSVTIKVIANPDAVIITNKKQLSRRFANDAAVYSVLAKAYSTANSQRGVVYDLEDYITGHPWNFLDFYFESAKNPSMTNNAYAAKAASFAKEKCGKCSNILILGDDYVVPMYRIDYSDVAKWYEFWQVDNEIKYIYSNQPYIPTTAKTLIDSEKIIERQDTLIIVSPKNKYSLSSGISKLKTTLKDYEITIKTIDAESVDCDSKFKLGAGNLILIGNREDNNAIKCTPWFDDIAQKGDGFDSSITLERNVWGGDASYAFVISGSKPEIGLDALNKILAAPEYYQNTIVDNKNKVYLYELSDPPDILSMGEIWSGYVLGNCEKVSGGWAEQGSCMASDMTLGVAPVTSVLTDVRDMVQFCLVKNIKAALTDTTTTGILDQVVCVSSTGGAVAGVAVFIPISSAPSAVADAFAALTKRIAKSLLELFGSEKAVIKKLDTLFQAKIFKFSEFFKFFKINTDWKHPVETVKSMWSGTNRLIKILADNKAVWKKITAHFSEDQLKLIKNVDDFDDLAVGTKKVLGHIPSGSLNDINIADKAKKAKALLDTGTVANIPKIKGVDGTKGLAERIARGEQGALFEAESAAMIHKKGNTVDWVGQKIKNANKQDWGEVDIRVIDRSGKVIGVEVKDVAWEYLQKNNPRAYGDALDNLGSQLKKMNVDLKNWPNPAERIDKVGFISKQPITADVDKLVKKYCDEVLPW